MEFNGVQLKSIQYEALKNSILNIDQSGTKPNLVAKFWLPTLVPSL